MSSESWRMVSRTFPKAETTHTYQSQANACTWQQLIAVFPEDVQRKVRRGWHESVFSTSTLFYANIYGLGKHFLIRQGSSTSSEEKLLHLQYQGHALHATAQEIKNVQQSGARPSDALIVAVLLLAAYNAPSSATFKLPSPKISESEQCNIPSWSSVDHGSALQLLVQQSGGLESIQTDGIADMIAW